MVKTLGDNLPFRRAQVIEFRRFAWTSREPTQQLAKLEGSGVPVESITGFSGEAPAP